MAAINPENPMRKFFFCAALLLALPAGARASSATDALRDFSLLGTWASACDEGASPTNSHATYLVTGSDGIQLKSSFGAGYEDSIYDIQDAKQVAPDKLSLRQVLVGNDRVTLDIVLLKDNDRIRIWSSLFPDGTALVEDGLMASQGGRETRWLARCPQ
jgi:hypothetical protein